MMKSGYDYERLKALRKAIQYPLRWVVNRSTDTLEFPFYQDEELECGHTLPRMPMVCRQGVWMWPQRRRCWKCEPER